jgi:cell fate regulator YaaT (PSP1 superfamily)
MPIHLDLMPEEEKILEAPPPKTIVVRYGYLKEIGEFTSDLTSKVGCGTKLVVRTDRGTEVAEMLTTTCGNGGCNKSITRDKLLSYIENSGGRDYPFTENGRVLRVATTQDLAEQSKLNENRKKHIDLARELVTRHSLPMKVVDVEYLLGGERVLFYFTSEQRVDFRLLVRDLAHDLHTRIELRQVGARDEARLVADYEKCGQHCCCKQFLKVLTPISMRSAKVQKATLDPTKISGRCGRLMCCLRYEDETYEELKKKLPRRNTRVRTEKGDGWVIDGQILTQLVLVQYDDAKREAVPMEKILEFDRPKPVGPDGRVMQTPNDRPPPQMGPEGASDPGRRGPGAGSPGGRRGPETRRPSPGAPAPVRAGDPLAVQGPTGGDLNTGDDIDDLIADAMDGATPAVANGSSAIPPSDDDSLDDPRAARPMAPPPPPQSPQKFRPQAGGPNRGPQRFEPPRQAKPQGFRPPQKQAPKPPSVEGPEFPPSPGEEKPTV